MSRASSSSNPKSVPVFPLPNAVFFPRTVLPLHVFEPRYRQLVRDAVAGDGRFAVSLLAAGWEADYAGSPPFHEVGTIGRIENLNPLKDGRFNLHLVGLQRCRLGQVIRERPYRLVEARVIPEAPVDDRDAGIVAAKLELLASQSCVLREMAAPDDHPLIVDDRVPFEAAVNLACATLPVQPSLRQELLEQDDLRERARRAAQVFDQVLERLLTLKRVRAGGSEVGDVN